MGLILKEESKLILEERKGRNMDRSAGEIARQSFIKSKKSQEFSRLFSRDNDQGSSQMAESDRLSERFHSSSKIKHESTIHEEEKS